MLPTATTATTADNAPDANPAAASALRRTSPSWRVWLGTAGGVFLGLVLLVAAWAKALDPPAFAEQIQAEGLAVFGLSAGAVALIALGLEVGLGLALVLGIRRPWVLVPATLLVAFFVFLTGRAYWRDLQGIAAPEAAGCGCFGNLVQRTPAEAFWQDLAMLVPPLLLAWTGRRGGRTFPPLRTGLVAVLTLAALGFAWKAPDLPQLDDVATRLKPGVKLAEICAGEGPETICLDTLAPELRQGEHLVVITPLSHPEIEVFAAEFNAYVEAGKEPPLTVLSSATAEEHFEFTFRHGPVFRLVEVPAVLLRPLYRRPPRAFAVRDGVVTETPRDDLHTVLSPPRHPPYSSN
ncbi:MAG TPA: DoxX family protein [Thermoanaerobaculia bacterium]|nr:DoxX family protein [Thermoanaerobaculia bacterium]